MGMADLGPGGMGTKGMEGLADLAGFIAGLFSGNVGPSPQPLGPTAGAEGPGWGRGSMINMQGISMPSWGVSATPTRAFKEQFPGFMKALEPGRQFGGARSPEEQMMQQIENQARLLPTNVETGLSPSQKQYFQRLGIPESQIPGARQLVHEMGGGKTVIKESEIGIDPFQGLMQRLGMGGLAGLVPEGYKEYTPTQLGHQRGLVGRDVSKKLSYIPGFGFKNLLMPYQTSGGAQR